MLGVTHLIAVDGYSRKNAGFMTLPVKNVIAIYHLLMRPLYLADLREQIWVDHGHEFAFSAAVPGKSLTSTCPQSSCPEYITTKPQS